MLPSDRDFEAKFTMESERGGIVEEPPFHILVLGDWVGAGEKKALDERRPIEIDRDNFDEVLTQLGVRLEIDMQGSGSVPLEFHVLDDFHPDRIFAQVPLFSQLRDVRRRLLGSDSFYDAAREVRSWFNVPEAAAEPSTANETEIENVSEIESGGLLDAILSQPSGSAASPAAKHRDTSELGVLISDIVRPHLVSVDENEQSALLAAVDAATSDLMRKIIHNHRFQALESAWRGLYFLVRRTETATDLKIYILDAAKEELADNLKSVSSLAESRLYRFLIEEAIETPGGEPWAAVFGNYAFSPNLDDTATLMRLAKLSAAADAPFVSHIRPEVLGTSSLSEHTDPADWDLSTISDAGRLWVTLRGIPEAQYLGLTIPRFLSRLPYGADTEPLESFAFEEFANEPVHDLYLWSNSCFAAALLLCRSYSAYGWEMGRSLIQDLEDLPVHVYQQNGEIVYKPCAEVLLTQAACEKLMEYGLMPLVSYKNTDHIKLARFQSIADPVTALKGRWN